MTKAVTRSSHGLRRSLSLRFSRCRVPSATGRGRVRCRSCLASRSHSVRAASI
ncbi:hypothetical protein ACFPRL_11500 [Pseudoclavibacter helvolus]